MDPLAVWLLVAALGILVLAGLTAFCTWIAYGTVQWCKRGELTQHARKRRTRRTTQPL